jgi:hypothetical protein
LKVTKVKGEEDALVQRAVDSPGESAVAASVHELTGERIPEEVGLNIEPLNASDSPIEEGNLWKVVATADIEHFPRVHRAVHEQLSQSLHFAAVDIRHVLHGVLTCVDSYSAKALPSSSQPGNQASAG